MQPKEMALGVEGSGSGKRSQSLEPYWESLEQAEAGRDLWEAKLFHSNITDCLRFWLHLCLAYFGGKNSQKYTTNSSQNTKCSDGEGNKASFGSFFCPLKEKFFIWNSSVFDLIPTKGWCCDGDFLFPACVERLRFPQPGPATSLLPLKPSWGALQRACAAKSACVFWHLNGRLVSNFPLNPFIAQIPVETTSISGLPYGACLGSTALVTPHKQCHCMLLFFLCVQHVFKMKDWPQTPLWMAVRS